jgi:hypothetical protein
MKFRQFLLLGLVSVFIFISLISVPPAHAILGDINGNEIAGEIADVVYLLQYLFEDGAPPVVRNDADLDNCPGINLGDLFQLIDYVQIGGSFLFPPVGTDLIVPSGIKITTGWVDGSPGDTVCMEVKINTVNQPDLYGLVIPLSYQNLPGQVELRCDNISFLGTLLEGTGAGFEIDEINKKVIFYGYPELFADSVVIPSGSDGVLARIDFEVLNPGTPTEITATYFPPEHTMLLISKFAYDAEDAPGRMLLPKFFLNYVGDVDADGGVTVSDIVYLINYLFRNGDPPLDP